uniref:Uncharacterized protein n=1 Tax=Anguilla anguilla TaxID=7936 RepID=A0A0E9VG80_ANGAN
MFACGMPIVTCTAGKTFNLPTPGVNELTGCIH